MTTSPHLTRLAPAVAAGLALLAIPTAWAVAEPATSSSGSSGERVISLLNWTITEARTDDIGPAGDSSGDTFQAAVRLTG